MMPLMLAREKLATTSHLEEECQSQKLISSEDVPFCLVGYFYMHQARVALVL